MNPAEYLKYRQDAAARQMAVPEALKRIEARRFLETPELPTGFGTMPQPEQDIVHRIEPFSPPSGIETQNTVGATRHPRSEQ